MQRELRGGIARSLEGPGKCRREEISGQRCGRGVCLWLCRPRPSPLRPVFPGRYSVRWCGQQSRRYPSSGLEFTPAHPCGQTRAKRLAVSSVEDGQSEVGRALGNGATINCVEAAERV